MRILLATDGSEYSETAARYLQRLGFGPDTEIRVFHALKEYLVTDEIDAARDFRKAGIKGAEAMVEEFKEFLMPTDARVTTLVREGTPWVEIVEAAEEMGADLIVMGHRGLTGISRFLMGSVAGQVARHGPYSTLLVRELPPLERPMRVVYCTDGSYSARWARDLIMSMPMRKDTTVHVLSVVDMDISSLPEKYYPDEEVSVMMATLRDHTRRQAEAAAEEDLKILRGRFDYVDVHVVFGVPDVEILKAAEGLSADLLALGSKGLRGLKGALLGSTSQRVMRHADCSVLIAKITNRRTGRD